MRHGYVDNKYPDHTESWAGLHEQKLHELYYAFRIGSPPERDMVLHLPFMGMPPREPTEEMMQQVRKGQKFSSFFKYATIVKATDPTTTSYQGVQINGRRPF